jgi:hypothetical protein
MLWVVSGPELLIPAGDWAEWVSGIGTLVAIGVGLGSWRKDRQDGKRDRRRSIWLEESAQARQVGAFLVDAKTNTGGDGLKRTIINASGLPIRNVMSDVTSREGATIFSMSFFPMAVLLPGESDTQIISTPVVAEDCFITVSFEDENGAMWEKRTSRPPERIGPRYEVNL